MKMLRNIASMIFFLMFFLAFSTPVFSNGPGNDPKASGMFSILGSNFQGEHLIIEYEIQYPGLMKVRMFDANDNLLWRSQYVDDIRGKHQVILKANRMKPGSYRFEFEYKNQFESLFVSR